MVVLWIFIVTAIVFVVALILSLWFAEKLSKQWKINISIICTLLFVTLVVLAPVAERENLKNADKCTVTINEVQYVGDYVFTDGAIYAILSKDANELIFAGDGAVNEPWKWVRIDDKDKVLVKCITFADGITSVGDSAFSTGEFTNLSKVVFEGDINVIGCYAFAGNQNLSEVDIKGGCLRIGSFAFFDCPALEEVSLPEGCEVADDAFLKTSFEATNLPKD